MKPKKIVSILTGIFFILNQLFVPASSWAAVGAGSLNEVNIPKSFKLELPTELGTIETISTGNGPTLIHIQEAHGNYEVQKNISKILSHLKVNYGIDLILLEGNAFKLQPQLIRFFPDDMKKTREIAEKLAEGGIVSGPELFFLDEANVTAYGIENFETYNQNGAAFIKVLRAREQSRAFLDDMELQIERLTSPYLNKDLRSFLKRVDNFSAGGGSAFGGESHLIPFDQWLEEIKSNAVKYLGIDLDNPWFQMEWPMLLRVFTLKKFESKMDRAQFQKERGIFLKAIRGIPSDLSQEIERLLSLPLNHHSLPDPETGLLFERMISSLRKDFDYKAYPNVNLFIGHLILQSELSASGGKGSGLMEEMDRLTNQITGKLAKNDKEKTIISLFKQRRLLKRLFRLEFTPEDYEKIKLQMENLRPSAVISRFTALNKEGRVRDSAFRHLAEIEVLFDAALEFYRGAKERDTQMIHNIEKHLKEIGSRKAVVITGGFHAGPFQNHFEANHYNYALITPKMTEIKGQEDYVQMMLRRSQEKSQATPATYRPSEVATGDFVRQPNWDFLRRDVFPAFGGEEIAKRTGLYQQLLRSSYGEDGQTLDRRRSEIRSSEEGATRYQQAQKGIHPEIKGQSDAVTKLAFMYHLSDLFNPLSLHVAEKVSAVLDKKYQEVVERGGQVVRLPFSQELFRIPFKNQVVAPFEERPSIEVYEKHKFYEFVRNLDVVNVSYLPPRRILQFYKRLRDSYLSKMTHDEDRLHLLRWSGLALANADNGSWFIQRLHTLITKQVKNFYWSPTGLRSGKISPFMENGSVPIGAYGPDFSMNLLIATRVLLHLAEEMGWKMAAEIHRDNRDLIEKATARGRDAASFFPSQGSIENSDWMASGPLLTLLEGIISISDAIWLLMAEKIDGIEDPSEALRFIVSKGLIARLSLISKTGLVGPFRFRGRYIPNLLRYSQQGVDFAPEVKALKSKTGVLPDMGQTKMGCPAGHACEKDMSSGIQALTEVFLRIYEKVASDESVRDKLTSGDHETPSKKQEFSASFDEDLVPIKLYQPQTAEQGERMARDKNRFAEEFGPWSPDRAWEVNVELQLDLAHKITELAPSLDEVDLLSFIQMWFRHSETGEEFIRRLRESSDSNPNFMIEKMSWSSDYFLTAAVDQEAQKIRMQLEKLYKSLNKPDDIETLSNKLAEIDKKLSRLTHWDILNRYESSYALQLSYVVQQFRIGEGNVIDILDDFAEFRHHIEDYGNERVELIVPYHQIKRSWFVVGSDYRAFRIQGSLKVSKSVTRTEEEKLISKEQIPWIKARFISRLKYWSLDDIDTPLIKRRRHRFEIPIIQHTIDDILTSLDPKSKEAQKFTKEVAQQVKMWPDDKMFPTLQREDGTYQIDWRNLAAVEQKIEATTQEVTERAKVEAKNLIEGATKLIMRSNFNVQPRNIDLNDIAKALSVIKDFVEDIIDNGKDTEYQPIHLLEKAYEILAGYPLQNAKLENYKANFDPRRDLENIVRDILWQKNIAYSAYSIRDGMKGDNTKVVIIHWGGSDVRSFSGMVFQYRQQSSDIEMSFWTGRGRVELVLPLKMTDWNEFQKTVRYYADRAFDQSIIQPRGVTTPGGDTPATDNILKEIIEHEPTKSGSEGTQHLMNQANPRSELRVGKLESGGEEDLRQFWSEGIRLAESSAAATAFDKEIVFPLGQGGLRTLWRSMNAQGILRVRHLEEEIRNEVVTNHWDYLVLRQSVRNRPQNKTHFVIRATLAKVSEGIKKVSEGRGFIEESPLQFEVVLASTHPDWTPKTIQELKNIRRGKSGRSRISEDLRKKMVHRRDDQKIYYAYRPTLGMWALGLIDSQDIKNGSSQSGQKPTAITYNERQILTQVIPRVRRLSPFGGKSMGEAHRMIQVPILGVTARKSKGRIIPNEKIPDFNLPAIQRGTRVIELSVLSTPPFKSGHLNMSLFKDELQNKTYDDVNAFIFIELGFKQQPNEQQIQSVTTQKLTRALNGILRTKDFYQKIGDYISVESLTPQTRKLLKVSKERDLVNREIWFLNRAFLESVYINGITRPYIRGKRHAENTTNEYWPLEFREDQEGKKWIGIKKPGFHLFEPIAWVLISEKDRLVAEGTSQGTLSQHVRINSWKKQLKRYRKNMGQYFKTGRKKDDNAWLIVRIQRPVLPHRTGREWRIKFLSKVGMPTLGILPASQIPLLERTFRDFLLIAPSDAINMKAPFLRYIDPESNMVLYYYYNLAGKPELKVQEFPPLSVAEQHELIKDLFLSRGVSLEKSEELAKKFQHLVRNTPPFSEPWWAQFHDMSKPARSEVRANDKNHFETVQPYASFRELTRDMLLYLAQVYEGTIDWEQVFEKLDSPEELEPWARLVYENAWDQKKNTELAQSSPLTTKIAEDFMRQYQDITIWNAIENNRNFLESFFNPTGYHSLFFQSQLWLDDEQGSDEDDDSKVGVEEGLRLDFPFRLLETLKAKANFSDDSLYQQVKLFINGMPLAYKAALLKRAHERGDDYLAILSKATGISIEKVQQEVLNTGRDLLALLNKWKIAQEDLNEITNAYLHYALSSSEIVGMIDDPEMRNAFLSQHIAFFHNSLPLYWSFTYPEYPLWKGALFTFMKAFDFSEQHKLIHAIYSRADTNHVAYDDIHYNPTGSLVSLGFDRDNKESIFEAVEFTTLNFLTSLLHESLFHLAPLYKTYQNLRIKTLLHTTARDNQLLLSGNEEEINHSVYAGKWKDNYANVNSKVNQLFDFAEEIAKASKEGVSEADWEEWKSRLILGLKPFSKDLLTIIAERRLERGQVNESEVQLIHEGKLTELAFENQDIVDSEGKLLKSLVEALNHKFTDVSFVTMPGRDLIQGQWSGGAIMVFKSAYAGATHYLFQSIIDMEIQRAVQKESLTWPKDQQKSFVLMKKVVPLAISKKSGDVYAALPKQNRFHMPFFQFSFENILADEYQIKFITLQDLVEGPPLKIVRPRSEVRASGKDDFHRLEVMRQFEAYNAHYHLDAIDNNNTFDQEMDIGDFPAEEAVDRVSEFLRSMAGNPDYPDATSLAIFADAVADRNLDMWQELRNVWPWAEIHSRIEKIRRLGNLTEERQTFARATQYYVRLILDTAEKISDPEKRKVYNAYLHLAQPTVFQNLSLSIALRGELLSRRLRTLKLAEPVQAILAQHQIHTLQDLTRSTPQRLRQMVGLDTGAINAIQQSLQPLGLTLSQGQAPDFLNIVQAITDETIVGEGNFRGPRGNKAAHILWRLDLDEVVNAREVEELRKLLKSRSEKVQQRALRVLSSVSRKSPHTLKAVFFLIGSEDSKTHRLAGEVFEKLEEPLDYPDALEWVREELAREAPFAIALLDVLKGIQVTEDEDIVHVVGGLAARLEQIRSYYDGESKVLDLLSRYKDKSSPAIPAILQYYSQNKAQEGTKEHVLSALVKINPADDQVVEFLKERLRADDMPLYYVVMMLAEAIQSKKMSLSQIESLATVALDELEKAFEVLESGKAPGEQSQKIIERQRKLAEFLQSEGIKINPADLSRLAGFFENKQAERDDRVRHLLITALGKSGDASNARVIQVLKDQTSFPGSFWSGDTDESRLYPAVKMLAEFQSENAAEVLIEIVGKELKKETPNFDSGRFSHTTAGHAALALVEVKVKFPVIFNRLSKLAQRSRNESLKSLLEEEPPQERDWVKEAQDMINVLATVAIDQPEFQKALVFFSEYHKYLKKIKFDFSSLNAHRKILIPKLLQVLQQEPRDQYAQDHYGALTLIGLMGPEALSAISVLRDLLYFRGIGGRGLWVPDDDNVRRHLAAAAIGQISREESEKAVRDFIFPFEEDEDQIEARRGAAFRILQDIGSRGALASVPYLQYLFLATLSPLDNVETFLSEEQTAFLNDVTSRIETGRGFGEDQAITQTIKKILLGNKRSEVRESGSMQTKMAETGRDTTATLKSLAEQYTGYLVLDRVRQKSPELFKQIVEALAAKHGFAVKKAGLEVLSSDVQAFFDSEAGKSIRALFESSGEQTGPSRMIRVNAASASELAVPMLRSILDRNFTLFVVVDNEGAAQDLKIEARAYARNHLNLDLNEQRFQVVVQDDRGIVPTLSGLVVKGEKMAIIADGEKGDEISTAFDELNVRADSLRLIDNTNLTIAEEMVLSATLLDQRTYQMSQQVQFTSQHMEGPFANLLSQARALAAILQAA